MSRKLSVVFFLTLSAIGAQAFAQTADRSRLDSLWRSALRERLVIDAAATEMEKEAEEEPAEPVVVAVSASDSLRLLAGDYMDAYHYEEAAAALRMAYALCETEQEQREVAEALKGCSIAQKIAGMVAQVVPVDRHTFSADDFFLYYPFPDGSWREVENAPAIFYQGGEEEIYISRESAVSQIYTLVEGNRMYFSSKTLPGLGGYDLFYSDWNEGQGEWDEPVNMGFPFNSPADDMLFMNTPDGKYSIFSSNRFETADSVSIYVLEHVTEFSYVREHDPERLIEISHLRPSSDFGKIDISSAAGESLQAEGKTGEYIEKSAVVRSLRERLENYEGNAEGREMLREQLLLAEEELTAVENDFLRNGAGDESGRSEVERKVVVTDGAYTFIRKNLGPKIKVVYIED